MKDPILLKTSEIVDYIGGLWRTPEFQAAHTDPSSYVRGLVKGFANCPRVFYTMNDPHLETSHFSIWWSCVALRDETFYPNPMISDLYYLHEIAHGSNMAWVPGLAFNQWYKKSAMNEFFASFASEVAIYFYMPEIRKKAFSHDIWADRFLDHPNYRNHFTHDSDMRRLVEQERKRAMTTPDVFDFLELQVANYREQNLAWGRIWAARYDLIETFMAGMTESEAVDELKLTELMTFLSRYSTGEGRRFGTIPFMTEAMQFSEVYQQNKKLFGNQMVQA